ncbi:5'/3'-nucleotidase SurE [soil metagenome]
MTGTVSAKLEVDPRRRPRQGPINILMTNDDGVASPGLRTLAAALGSRHRVRVVAPEDERSGSGTGIGHFDPTRGVDVVPVEMGEVEAFAIAGPPGLAVMSAALGAFGDPPDLVISGTNAGINTGHSVLHSGTVGAVLTARTFGIDGLAVSLAQSDPWQWQTAAAVASPCVEWLAAHDKSRLTLNLNVPAVETSAVRGIRWADLDAFGYFRLAIADVPGRSVQFEVGPPEDGLDPGSDTALVREGFATLTPLTTVEPAAFPAEAPPTL